MPRKLPIVGDPFDQFDGLIDHHKQLAPNDDGRHHDHHDDLYNDFYDE